MDTTPLPNREEDLSDSDSLSTSSLSLSYYAIRITSHGKFTYDELKAFLEAEPVLCRYVVGRETVPQEHFHIVAGVDDSIQIQDVKDIIRAFICPLWQTESGSLPRGFGNKQYNCQLSVDVDRAVSYALKLQDYTYVGFSDDYIASRLAESFEKKKPSNFKSEYMVLCTRFQESDMDVREFMTEYCQLKAKYGQQVRMSDAYGYALSNLIMRDPSQAEDFVENYLNKV